VNEKSIFPASRQRRLLDEPEKRNKRKRKDGEEREERRKIKGRGKE
jgi:hypothetical protein